MKGGSGFHGTQNKANCTAGTHQQWKTDALNQVLAIILLGILFFTGYLVGLIEYLNT